MSFVYFLQQSFSPFHCHLMELIQTSHTLFIEKEHAQEFLEASSAKKE